MLIPKNERNVLSISKTYLSKIKPEFLCKVASQINLLKKLLFYGVYQTNFIRLLGLSVAVVENDAASHPKRGSETSTSGSDVHHSRRLGRRNRGATSRRSATTTAAAPHHSSTTCLPTAVRQPTHHCKGTKNSRLFEKRLRNTVLNKSTKKICV